MQKQRRGLCFFGMAFFDETEGSHMYDVVVLGAGVVGCAIARELTRYALSVCVLERAEDVCCGTSKSNSAIIHAGFDARPGSNKAKYNLRGNAMMDQLSQELDIPFRRNGSLVLCFAEEDLPRLHELYERGVENGVPGLELLTGEQVRAMESAVSDEVVGALHAPTGGIVCPFHMTYALFENARANGAEFRFDSEVRALRAIDGGYEAETAQGSVKARLVINAAGVFGDVLHNQVCEDKVRIVPRKGEYCLFDKKDGGLVDHTIFQLPGALGKGVLVTPTIHGNLLVGPTAEDIENRFGTNTTAAGLSKALTTAARSVPNLPLRDVITSFAGLRAHAVGDVHDFIVGENAEGYFDVIGIESPGLSSAPALGEAAASWAAEKLGAAKKDHFVATRRGITDPRALPFEERQALTQRDPAYANIICRCEQISEAEIVEAIRRGAKSLDGVKRRTRAGMGRCQGGFCAPRVMEILSRELGVPQTALTKAGGQSNLLVGKTKEV